MNGTPLPPLPLHPELSFSQVLWINIRRDVRVAHSNEGVVAQGNGTLLTIPLCSVESNR